MPEFLIELTVATFNPLFRFLPRYFTHLPKHFKFHQNMKKYMDRKKAFNTRVLIGRNLCSYRSWRHYLLSRNRRLHAF